MAEPQPAVDIAGLTKHFIRRDGTWVPAVDDASLSVAPGEFVVLLGPSGCGKTTLLRCVGGLETPDGGRVTIHGDTQFDRGRHINVLPAHRHISMVFQSYALWPHMTAADNVGYPLRARKVPKANIGPMVNRALTLVGMPELARQHPNTMSGGQQQRVALARAIVSGDQVVLFDEPLSSRGFAPSRQACRGWSTSVWRAPVVGLTVAGSPAPLNVADFSVASV